MCRYELHIEELEADGAFSDFVEGLRFYLRFRRANNQFPRRQVLRSFSIAVNPSSLACSPVHCPGYRVQCLIRRLHAGAHLQCC